MIDLDFLFNADLANNPTVREQRESSPISWLMKVTEPEMEPLEVIDYN